MSETTRLTYSDLIGDCDKFVSWRDPTFFTEDVYNKLAAHSDDETDYANFVRNLILYINGILTLTLVVQYLSLL